MEWGLLIIRAAVGLTLAAHGAQKLFGAFGGHGIAGTGAFFESLGFRPGRRFAALAGLGELGGGLGVALGLLTPLAAATVVATMVVAVWSVHREKGFFATDGGYEYNFILVAAAAGIAFAGPGALSLDAALGLSLAGVAWGVAALALGIAGALPPLISRTVATRHVESVRQASAA
jgi:putative oxidoreductase